MRHITKWLLIIAAVAGVAMVTVAAVAYWPRRAGPKFVTAPITRGRVETVVNSTGKVKPAKSVSVNAFASGQVKLYVDFNSKVKKGLDVPDYPYLAATMAGLVALPLGQGHLTSAGLLFPDKTLLAEIDPRLFAAKVKSDRAALKKEQAGLLRARFVFKESAARKERAVELRAINKGNMSEDNWDELRFKVMTSEADIESADAAVEQAKANLDKSEADLTYTKVWATENGVIIERKADQGQVLRSDFQTTELFVIAAEMDRHMHIHGSVDEADIGLITTAYNKQDRLANAPVSFTVDAYPGELFEGKIFQIRNNSTTEQNVVTYPVVIETTNPGEKLRPNMTATITFKLEARDDAVRLPVAALRFVPTLDQVRPEDRHFLEVPTAGGAKRSVTEKVDLARQRQNRIVWVEDGLYLRAVPVTLGLIGRQYAELVGGDLAEGQSVVANIDTTTR